MKRFWGIFTTVILIGVFAFSIWKFSAIQHKLQQLFGRNQAEDTTDNDLSGQLFGSSTLEPQKLDPQKIIDWTNVYRLQNGLDPLSENTKLVAAAKIKTDDMFENQYFEHISPTGVSPAQLVLSAGYNYKYAGENLALGGFKDEKDLVDAWMNSPGHRANILNKNYTEIGVAAEIGTWENDSTLIAVQEFGQPAPNCTAPPTSIQIKINEDKNKFKTLTNQANQTVVAAQNLYDQANRLISQGNDAAAAKDQTTAQAIWAEADQTRTRADNLQNEYEATKKQAEEILAETNRLVTEYNVDVNGYNKCIGK